jgi:hypothetical protein
MPYTIDSALERDLIEIVDRNDDFGSFTIRVGELETPVTIDIGRFLTSENAKFSVTHSIHTPVQGGPYRTSKPYAEDAAYALHRAIDGLISYYEEAVRAGHEPEESWLVEN